MCYLLYFLCTRDNWQSIRRNLFIIITHLVRIHLTSVKYYCEIFRVCEFRKRIFYYEILFL